MKAWALAWLSTTAALSTTAHAGTVRIDAVVDEDLRTIHGTMALEGFDELPTLSDPLARLPEPRNDLNLFRTYPGRPNQGQVSFGQSRDGNVAFTTRLPRRFGAIGSTHKGLFANGGWYPQLDGLPVVDWEVTVTLPDGATAALSDRITTDIVQWTGTAERAPLAVVRKARVTPLDDHGRLLTKGRPPKRVVNQLRQDLDRWPAPLTGVVVRAPLRRRLVRSGPGLAYLSDRAYRLTPGLEFAHRRSVTKGIATAWSSLSDPLGRELLAAGLAADLDAQLKVDTDRALRRWAWIPQINSLLASRRIAFYADILDLPYLGDTVADDLGEIYASHWPGAAIAAQLDAKHGEGTSAAIAALLANDIPLPLAMAANGLSILELEPYRTAVPRQDLTLEVDGNEVRIARIPAGRPDDVVVIRIDGVDEVVRVPDQVTLVQPEPPKQVRLDPEGATAQISRVGDTFPLRYQITAAAAIESINLTRGQLFGALYTTLRRDGDTRHLWAGSLSNSRSDLIRAGVAHFFKVGPLVDGFSRTQRIRIGGSSSILDQRFADTDGLRVALDGSLGWSWDTRVSTEFPLSGHRLFATVTGGVIPSGDIEQWGGLNGGAVSLVRLHPRLVLAGRASAAAARANVPHRLLTLGGLGAMRSVPVLPACTVTQPPPCADLATERLLGTAELRWAPIRNANVPMFLLWGTELQLTGGVEGVVAQVDGQGVRAAGVTAGLLGVGDVLGAETMSAGVVVGWPVAWEGIELTLEPLPEIYLRWTQAF